MIAYEYFPNFFSPVFYGIMHMVPLNGDQISVQDSHQRRV